MIWVGAAGHRPEGKQSHYPDQGCRAAGHSPEGSSLIAEGPIARVSPGDANSNRRRRDSAVESLLLARQDCEQQRWGWAPSQAPSVG